ncbi:MAG: BMP family ABC transporter substrate-binding protein [Ruminococcaceae bacterium]|nr:BMP family ABC transporter substrate-binding protein [Oscillospiraceae bacterium]
MKRKTIVALALTFLMALSLVACGTPASSSAPASTPAGSSTPESTPASTPESTPESTGGADGYEIALITDIGTIDDKSFNQGAWEGVVQYAEENNITHKYYQPTEKTDDAYLAGIDLAVEGGAKIIVTPGYLFEVPIFIAQETYPDVTFILIDGSPHNADYSEFLTADNTVGITYAEEQAGYLAGYAAVKDGNTKLGFMGGMAVPAVVRFGYGYIQGADAAAQEMGLGAGSITMNYYYTGDFVATPEIQTMSASWYDNDGVEVIFGCGGAVGNSVMAAAQASDKKVIGVDVDQSGESPTVITSAMKELAISVYDTLTNYYAGSFPGGQNLIFSAENDGVGLPWGSSKFETFTQADYDAIYAKLADGSITIVKDTDADGNEVKVEDVPTTAVVVTNLNA